MIVKMNKTSASSAWEFCQSLYDKNLELDIKRRKAAQARVPSDPNVWQQMRENLETIILEDHNFSEKHNIEFALWQLHYRRIEEFRAHYSAASASTGSTTSQTRVGAARPDQAFKIRLQFKTFLSEATGFYHDFILKIRAKYGLPLGQLGAEHENHKVKENDGKRSFEVKSGLISCHRCLVYLGDLARYKGLYGEGDTKSRDYAAASSYYLQAASLWPSSGNPHHQLAILATYSGDELMAVYRYFRSLAADNPFSTARDNLIVAFEKNRQSYSQLHGDAKLPSIKESPILTSGQVTGRVEPVVQSKEPAFNTSFDKERATVIHKTYKAFRVQFIRLNGILFTRTSLETFEEILSMVSRTLQELLSSGPEEELSDAVENGHFIVVLVSILIFTVHNVKGEAEGQSYGDIVQHTILLQDAFIAIYEIFGQILRRCLELSDPSSSFLLPGILVFMEWMACSSDAVCSGNDDKQTTVRSKFWNYWISFLNKLLSAGLVPIDEDTSCFANMTHYEEGEKKYQLALWEDFELRGFLPLKPAQTFLDFSRKQSPRGDGKKEKIARMKRILAAAKTIADTVRIDHKVVSFESKLKKFVVGVESPAENTSVCRYSGSAKSIGGIRATLSDATAIIVESQPKLELHVEGEEDDEVIVFRPSVLENRTEVSDSTLKHQEALEHVQNASMNTSHLTVPVSAPHIDLHLQNAVETDSWLCMPVPSVNPNVRQPYHFQSSMWSVNEQVPIAGIKGLSLSENGNLIKQGIPRNPEISSLTFQQAIGVRESDMLLTGEKASETMVHPIIDSTSASFRGDVTHVNKDTVVSFGADPSIMARNSCSTIATSYVKVSTSRPVRHIGPPPGFSTVRPKQVNELSSGMGQNPLNDDYSWLDGYQLQSSVMGGYAQSSSQSNLSSHCINDSVGTTSFPFPGKQVQVMHFEEEKQKSSQGKSNLESLNSHHEPLLQQYIPQLDQQGQSMWKGHHFV